MHKPTIGMCITKLATSLAKWQMLVITYSFMEIVHAILMQRANKTWTILKKKKKLGLLCKAGWLHWNCYFTFHLLLDHLKTKLFLLLYAGIPLDGPARSSTLLLQTTSVYWTVSYKHQYFPVISREERWALISVTPFCRERISIYIEHEAFNAFLLNVSCNTKT